MTLTPLERAKLVATLFSCREKLGFSNAGLTGEQSQAIDLTNPLRLDADAILQNRNRGGRASILQMKSIAANPDYDRLGPTKDFGSGAPVVAFGTVPANQKGKVTKAIMPDGARFTVQYAVVEAQEILTSNDINGSTRPEYYSDDATKIRAIAGNGRITGITDAYRQGNADSYRQQLQADARRLGLNPAVVGKMSAPILVRIMQPKDVTKDIGDRSNRQQGLAMTAVETANNDKNRIDFGKITLNEDGSLTMASLQNFIAQMPPEEQGAMVDEDGYPTKQAEDRANNAVFAKAYSNDGLTRLKAQALDPDAKSIINGLSIASGAMARLAGLPDGFDIRDIVADAAVKAVNAIRAGRRLDEEAMQTNITFTGGQDEEDNNEAAREILKMFAEYRRSAKAIGEKLKNVADQLYAEYQNRLNTLFGDEQNVSRSVVIRHALALDGVKMSGYGMMAWKNDGAAAMRWLLTGEGEKPEVFFDSLCEIAVGHYDI